MNHRDFFEAGFRVFPLWPIKDGKCTCEKPNCPPEAAGKHPRASNWQHTPVWSDEQMDNYDEYGFFETGYGILCNGWLVIDVDARNGGNAGYEKLIADYPQIAASGLIVSTGSGGGSKHLFFKAPPGAALVSKLKEYDGIDFKSSGFVVGAGSMHASGNRYLIAHGSPDDVDDPPADLITALTKPERHRSEYNGHSIDVAHDDIADMLKHIDPDCGYDVWIKIGMGTHHATDGTGLPVWDDWSQGGSKYDADVMERHWQSFGKSANPVTIGTVIHYAEQGGWVMPVSMSPEPEFQMDAAPPSDDEDAETIDTTGIDLLSPPGFVGEVANWIESQGRRPRRTLAVAAAIHALGNCFGLRYTDDLDGVTTNLFTFCVAGSRTGKESIQQSVSTVHRAADLAPCEYQGIKSEQEITRNLIRHQPALYVEDELGITLNKIQNAQKKGGAVYLDGVIGKFMSAYGKADGYMQLNGDAKDELKAEMERKRKPIQRRIDENEPRPQDEEMIASIDRSLASIDNGLEKPFLSLIGFTTPSTFENLVDFASATNGFIGRALIYNERNTAPRTKRDPKKGARFRYKRGPMPESMETTINALANGNEFDVMESPRIEHYDSRIEIPTTDDAVDMLNLAIDIFEDRAEAETAKTGLEALDLGAYELLSKISLILGVPSGTRDVEHVRFAYALVMRDINEKAQLVTANFEQEAKNVGAALAARIKVLCADENGETIGVIKNRVRSTHKPDDVEKIVAKMIEKGALVEVVPEAKKRGPKTKRYRSVLG